MDSRAGMENLLAWVLTFIYVIWANFSYDKRVEELKKEIR